jgi:hypothetical protein
MFWAIQGVRGVEHEVNPMNEFLSRHAADVLLGSGRQCTATNRNGERCRKAPLLGQTICELHGGKAPLSLKAGQARLAMLVEPVLETFRDILDMWHSTRCTGCGHVDAHGNRCTGCGNPTGDPMPVIRVGQLVLDRAGFHPTLTVVQQPPMSPFEGLTIFEVADRAEEMARVARAMADEEAARLLPDYTEGILVPDDEPIQNGSVPFRDGNDTPEEGTSGSD